MKELVFLLEEQSAKIFLSIIISKLQNPYPVRYIVFDGKQDLEKNISRKLKAYCNPNAVFIILRDQDSGDCLAIKNRLVNECFTSGKKSFLVRIACHELETFYLADLKAVEKAYCKPIGKFQNNKKYRIPDFLENPKCELKKICPEYREIDGARKITPYIDITNIRSTSFKNLVNGIQKLIIQFKEIDAYE